MTATAHQTRDTRPTREALAAAVPGARATVIGGQRSGLAAARLLARQGAMPFLTERGPAPEGTPEALARAGVESEWDGHTARALAADFAVVSPGVPTSAPLVQQMLRAGVPVYAEIEVASWFCAAPIVAITGSNGKTTTTSLVAHVFATAGRPHVVAGNIGYAFADYADDVTDDTAVILEVSSFQLDHIATFRPHVAVLLNVTPDHLDRYDHSFEAYAAAKYRVFENLAAGDWLVASADDPVVTDRVVGEAFAPGVTVVLFSQETEATPGAFVRDGQIVLRLPVAAGARSVPASPAVPPFTEETLMPTSDLALPGRHNLYNSLAAAVVARAMEIRSDVVRESLTSFEGVPHRLEKVRTVGGVAYVNDSKATNVNAVWYALESFPRLGADGRGVVLIAGGRDKGNDYEPLQRLVAERVKGIVAIGEGADAVEAALGPFAPHLYRADSMEEAVQYARVLAEPGDTVLLSPACASFDMFDDYEDRGDTFKKIVQGL